MKLKNIFKKFFKITFIFSLITIFTVTPVLPGFVTPFTPKQTLASCQNDTSRGGGDYTLDSRVGGVSLDQAATFLADMTEYTGAYYDEELDRIVFLGKTNTSAPEFDKDDLAVAIKSLLFDKTIPQVSLETAPGDTNITQPVVVEFHGPLKDTKFGQKLVEADFELKKYTHGYDENDNPIQSNVSTYKSAYQLYFDNYQSTPPTQEWHNHSRWVLVPDLVTAVAGAVVAACTLPVSGTAMVVGGLVIGGVLVGSYLLDQALSPVPGEIVQGGKDVTNNPTKPPGDDWEWRPGKDGKGAWVRGDKTQGTKESLSPDNNNPAHPPHTDYTNPQGKQFRIYPDGTVEPK